jgi:hypothetical protein
MAYQFDGGKRKEAANRLTDFGEYLSLATENERRFIRVFVNDSLKNALQFAVDELKRPNPCDNCIGPGLAVSHGYMDMQVKEEVDNG